MRKNIGVWPALEILFPVMMSCRPYPPPGGKELRDVIKRRARFCKHWLFSGNSHVLGT